MTMTTEIELTAPKTPEESLSLLRTQNTLYGELELLAQRQRSLIPGEDTRPLLALLADRQKLSSRLTGIAQELEPIRRDWGNYRGRLTPPDQEEADKLLSETQETVQRVIEGDEEDARLLAARRQKAARALTEAHSASEAISAYRVPSERSGCLDQSDEDQS